MARKAVTTVLTEAGFTKAGRYTPFDGYVDKDGNPKPGVKVRKNHDGTKATVLFCGYGSVKAQEMVPQIVAALTEAGYECVGNFSHVEVKLV